MNGIDRLEDFIGECRRAAKTLLAVVPEVPYPLTVVHHNDADGVAAAAVLARAFRKTGLRCRLLPVEKIHETIVERIHAGTGGVVVYADLGGQSSHLISRHAGKVRQVIILDHHLPGGPVSGKVVHCNCERYGISGDDASGASVCALFARELLRTSRHGERRDEAWLAAMGVVGAVGDGQDQKGVLTGLNGRFLDEALREGVLEPWGGEYRIPDLQQMTLDEVVDVLTLLGSVGFYSGSTEKGVDFLLGRNAGDALRLAGRLRELKETAFRDEAARIQRRGLAQSPHFEWVDVQDRFAPMGVKAIGLFLDHLIEGGMAAPDKYLIGFQYLPREMPGIGTLETGLTKLSARVHPALKTMIQEGGSPDFMTLIPEATARVAGVADGCHRFAAASLIERGKEDAFMTALEEALADAGSRGEPGREDR